MDRGSQVHEGIAEQPEDQPAPGPIDLALLGGASAAPEMPVHTEVTSRPSGPVTVANVLRLIEWQRYRCALTGRVLTPDTASLDHVKPVRSGGEHRIENVQVVHKDVNRAKTTMSIDEFVHLCREVVVHAGKETLEQERS